MRNCPVCDSDIREIAVRDYMNFTLYKCECGMHYIDGDVYQSWFDDYYLTKYKTDDEPYSDDRLNSMASKIASYEPRSVLDIGGMDGELQRRLVALGIKCDVTGVKNDNQRKYDFVVLSHTLEHIYDIPSMFQRILGNLGNRLFIEIPVWENYEDLTYDFHWQHINKFTKTALVHLLWHHGFYINLSEPLPDYREYHCHRVIAWHES